MRQTIMVIRVMIPLPTWNRLLAINYWQRKQIRDIIHTAVALALEGKELDPVSYEKYIGLIRPRSKNK